MPCLMISSWRLAACRRTASSRVIGSFHDADRPGAPPQCCDSQLPGSGRIRADRVSCSSSLSRRCPRLLHAVRGDACSARTILPGMVGRLSPRGCNLSRLYSRPWDRSKNPNLLDGKFCISPVSVVPSPPTGPYCSSASAVCAGCRVGGTTPQRLRHDHLGEVDGTRREQITGFDPTEDLKRGSRSLLAGSSPHLHSSPLRERTSQSWSVTAGATKMLHLVPSEFRFYPNFTILSRKIEQCSSLVRVRGTRFL